MIYFITVLYLYKKTYDSFSIICYLDKVWLVGVSESVKDKMNYIFGCIAKYL